MPTRFRDLSDTDLQNLSSVNNKNILKFNSTIKELTSRFDQVFICSSKRNGYTGLMALSDFDPGLVIISSLRRTKKIDIKNNKSRMPIDILFHD